jgi:hypothetical protein
MIMNTCCFSLSRSAVALVLGLFATAIWHQPAGAQVQSAYCRDAVNAAGANLDVPLKEYAVVLLGGSALRLDGPTRVIAKAAPLLKAPSPKYKREFYPVVRHDGEFIVQCQDPFAPEEMQFEVAMETTTPGDARDLVARLRGLTEESGFLRKAKGAASWPPFILLVKNGFQQIGSSWSKYVGLRSLMENYQGVQGDLALLADVPYQVKLSSPIPYLNLTHPARDGTSSGGQASAGGSQPGAYQEYLQQQQPAPQRPSASQQAAAAQQNRIRSGPPRQGPGTQTLAPPGPVHPDPVEVTIRFRANLDQWQAVLQQSRLDADQTLFVTFEYCSPRLTPMSGGAYRLNCTLLPDRKLPIRIRGFKELLITPDGLPLDDLLEVSGFSNPYPTNWKRSRTEFITVQSGPLHNVLGQHIPLSQGVTGCQTEIAGLSIENIVMGTLPFPQRPCTDYEISFPQVQLSPNAAVTGGCIPGLGEASPLLIKNNNVTCWARTGQPEATNVRAHLIDGFNDVELRISAGSEHREFAFDELANLLRPQWPYAPGLVEAGERPGYVARSVTYMSDNGTSCSAPIDPPVNGVFKLPTLSAAGCSQLPRRMSVAFEQDQNAQDSGVAPVAAFKPSFQDPVELAALNAGGRTVPLEPLKVPLPIQFSAEDARIFNAQFGTEAGNRQFPGVHVFRQGDCTNKHGGEYIAFNGSSQKTFTWPIKAAVFDPGEEALTVCATAVVGGVQSGGAPYLTFALKGSRAVGPRRAIVISMSSNLASRGGVKALQESLRTFVDQISGEVAHGARLSPINVLITTGSGDFRQLFSGEMAALDKDKVKSLLEQQQENVAPVTPDFRQLRFLPELRKDSNENFDHVTFVMDGSDVPPDDVDFLAGLANRLHDPDAIKLMIIGNCQPWMQQNQSVKCAQLPSDVSQRTDVLVKTFAKFINPADLQAANSPPSIEPAPQTRPVPPPVTVPAPPPSKGPGGRAK